MRIDNEQFYLLGDRRTVYAEAFSDMKQKHCMDVCDVCKSCLARRFSDNDASKVYFVGKKEGDYYKDLFLRVHIVSQRFLEILNNEKVTGFRSQDIEFSGWYDRTTKKPLSMDGSLYKEIVITGKGGYLLDLHGNDIPRCPKCGKIERFGIYAYQGFTTDYWDGSDMFFLKNWPGVLIVTEKVKKAVEKNKLKNIKFTKLSEFRFI